MSGDQGHVRVGTVEREAALSFLSQQFSEGRLDADEFARRSAAIGAAVTRGDLQGILADLGAAPPITQQGALADAINQRIGEQNRQAAYQADRQAAEQLAKDQINLSAADELAGLLIELAAYLATRVPPRRYQLLERKEWHRGSGLTRNTWNRVKPLPMSEAGWLMNRGVIDRVAGGLVSPTVILVPDGRLWESPYKERDREKRKTVPARYRDLRDGLLSLRGFEFNTITGTLTARECINNDFTAADRFRHLTPRDALAAIAAEIVAGQQLG